VRAWLIWTPPTCCPGSSPTWATRPPSHCRPRQSRLGRRSAAVPHRRARRIQTTEDRGVPREPASPWLTRGAAIVHPGQVAATQRRWDMPEVTDAVSDRPAQLVASGWVPWAYSPRDRQVHAFSIEARLRDRWLGAVCLYTVPLAAVGPRVGVTRRCQRCVLGVITPGTGRRHHQADRSGVWAWLIARVHSRTHAVQPPRCPVMTLPFTLAARVERDGRVSDTVRPGRPVALALVLPRPVHRRVAR
jgi:hypothetical protein